MRRNIKNIVNISSEYGLVIDWKFHAEKRWVSNFPAYLVERYNQEFRPVIISNQFKYDLYKKRLKFILSMEPGWAAPKISYDTRCNHKIAVMASDPHNKTEWFKDYVEDNEISYILSQYYSPFFYHFPNFPKERFIHFPWAVPDEFLSRKELSVQDDRVYTFGAQTGGAYDVRNWCREHDFVENLPYSGVENKQLNVEQYYDWLTSCDAIIAAGSSDPAYDLVTPKYFEISAAGALLIGQQCDDLARLGFTEDEMLIFNMEDFVEKVRNYRKYPEDYLIKREKGRQLVATKHLVSNRIDLLKQLFV